MATPSARARLLVLLLAFVPAVWGICPRWLFGERCGAGCSATGEADAAPRCPCCPPPASDGPKAPDDGGSCPVISLRHTVAPAPDAVALPPADLVALFVAGPPALGASAVVAAPAAAHPSAGPPTALGARPGGAPPLVGTVVQLV